MSDGLDSNGYAARQQRLRAERAASGHTPAPSATEANERIERVAASTPKVRVKAATTCRWCGRKVERISSGTWADGKPMLRHVDTLQPLCYVLGDDTIAEVAPDVE